MRKLAEFIVRENHTQHTQSPILSGEDLKLVQAILLEDASVFNQSLICVAMNKSEIVGSVKVTRWHNKAVLPIQRLFNIDPGEFEKMGAESIWHIGRFAISKKAKGGAVLLKRLITTAIYPVCCAANSIMLAECDRKFVRGLKLMGINTEQLADAINYLGSETLPIFSTRNWLNTYLGQSPYFDEIKMFYDNDVKANKLIRKSINTMQSVGFSADIIPLRTSNKNLLRAI